MARNETHVDVPPETVWAMLEDPYSYPRWVVGTDRTVEADAEWPEPGSAFTVRFPLGPADQTRSKEVEEGRRIVLDANGGPFGGARIEIRLRPEDGGTRVTLIEDPIGRVAPLRWVPPFHWLTWLRNTEALRRFGRLVQDYRAPSSA